MSIAGQKMHDPNLRLRLLLLVFGGIIASASLLYWRSEYLVSQEYIDFPIGASISSTKGSHSVQKTPSQTVPKGYEDLYK